MTFVVKNNAESTVADSPLAQAAVTLNVAAGEGANFPSTFPFLITLWDEETYPDPTDDPEMEITKCTARTTDAMTIVRAQEGTADVAHANGERAAMLITAGIIEELIADVVDDTTPQLGGTLDCNSKQVRESKGADVASATALTLGTDGNYYDVTGTEAITSINTLGIGTVVTLHFDAILVLTHNATDLILPGGANITTAAGDEAIFREYATGDWRCIAYTKASGAAIVGGDPLIAKSIADIATDINGFSTAAVPAGMMNGWAAGLSASIFNESGVSVPNKAAVCNETGLAAAVLNAICDNANISSATIKAILDIETVIVASQLGAMLEGTQLSLANAATVAETKYTTSQLNGAFINAIMSDNRVQELLNTTAYATRNLTGAASILYAIHDDWADSKLVSRDNRTTTAADVLGANEFAQKFRPEWTTVTGSPTAAGGKLVLDAISEEVSTPSTPTVGTWEADRSGALAGITSMVFLIMHNGGTTFQNSYFIQQQYPENYIYFAYESTDLISTAYSWDTANHTWKATRDASGNFEIFIDGVSKGTVLNTTMTVSATLGFMMKNADGDHSIDNLKVY